MLGNLAEALAKEGLATLTRSVPSIGYVGWATYGGYDAFSANFGLGADQIVAAKIVDAKCAIVKVDKRLVGGIRGGGGIFGVIVELTIKAYPMKTVSL